MTTKRRITLEITTDEAAEYAGVLVAVMNGLTCSGPPGETRIVCLSNTLMQEVTTLRAPEDCREGA